MIEKQKIDSCLILYHQAINDTSKVNAIYSLINEIWDGNTCQRYNLWLYNCLESLLKNSTNSNNKRQHSLLMAYAEAINCLGYFAENKGDISIALNHYQRSLKIREEINDKDGLTYNLNNIGMIFYQRGDIKMALEYNLKCLKIREELADTPRIAMSLNNIAHMYASQGELKEALKYYNQSYKLRLISKDIRGQGIVLTNIGSLYDEHGDFPCSEPIKTCKANGLNKALDNYILALEKYKTSAYKRGLAIIANNIGGVFRKQNKLDSALYYYQTSLTLKQSINDGKGTVYAYINLAETYLLLNDLNKSTHYANLALIEGKKLGFPSVIAKAANLLYRINNKQNNYKAALTMYELYVNMSDSVKNEETQKATIKQQTKYEFEKAQILKQQEEKELARLQAEEIKRRNNLQYSLIMVSIVVVFSFVLFLGFTSVSASVVEGLIFFAFLLFFEFLLVLFDPYVNSLSGGEPLYNLLLNALIACFIFPAHSFFEKLLKKRLVRNKKS